jgi:hypothetical protein
MKRTNTVLISHRAGNGGHHAQKLFACRCPSHQRRHRRAADYQSDGQPQSFPALKPALRKYDYVKTEDQIAKAEAAKQQFAG